MSEGTEYILSPVISGEVPVRAIGLLLLLVGVLLLLWPGYGHFFRFIRLGSEQAQLYAGLVLLAGVAVLLFDWLRRRDQ
jgi:hypothetical protein